MFFVQLIRLARPHHWIKNVFVVLPLPFALAAGARIEATTFLIGLLGFSLVTSAVYVFNDIQDGESDRLNPAKIGRPLAAGLVSTRAAWVWSAALLAAGLGLCWATQVPSVVALALVYIVANVSYSLQLKHVALIDVFLLASGYLIRVLLGCSLVQAPPSSWLLTCTSALALFLALTKRRADLIAGVSAEHRPVLAEYSLDFLNQAMGITGGIALLSYALYSIEAPFFREGRELAAMPFVAFAILYYLLLAYTKGAGASPVALAYRSVPLQVCAAGWMLTTAWSLGLF